MYKVTKADDQDERQPGHLENAAAHALQQTPVVPCRTLHLALAAIRTDGVPRETGAALTARGQRPSIIHGGQRGGASKHDCLQVEQSLGGGCEACRGGWGGAGRGGDDAATLQEEVRGQAAAARFLPGGDETGNGRLGAGEGVD